MVSDRYHAVIAAAGDLSREERELLVASLLQGAAIEARRKMSFHVAEHYLAAFQALPEPTCAIETCGYGDPTSATAERIRRAALVDRLTREVIQYGVVAPDPEGDPG